MVVPILKTCYFGASLHKCPGDGFCLKQFSFKVIAAELTPNEPTCHYAFDLLFLGHFVLCQHNIDVWYREEREVCMTLNN